MKKIFYIAICLLFVNIGFAQTKIVGTDYTIQGKKFFVKPMDFNNFGYYYYYITTTETPVVRAKQSPECQTAMTFNDFHDLSRNKADLVRLYKVYRKVFTATREKQLGQDYFKNDLSITFLTNRATGKIIELTFSVHQDTIITQEEILKLETFLRAEMYFTYPTDLCTDLDYYVTSESPVFGLLYDAHYSGRGEYWYDLEHQD
jgi:hypothetical protein